MSEISIYTDGLCLLETRIKYLESLMGTPMT
jgi:hypothetical protein